VKGESTCKFFCLKKDRLWNITIYSYKGLAYSVTNYIFRVFNRVLRIQHKEISFNSVNENVSNKLFKFFNKFSYTISGWKSPTRGVRRDSSGGHHAEKADQGPQPEGLGRRSPQQNYQRKRCKLSYFNITYTLTLW
jgi:hypothetical protein